MEGFFHGQLAPLLRVIGKPAGLAAFRAGNARTDVRQADFDSPGVVEAQESGIVRGECVHPGNLRQRSSRNDRTVPRNSAKNQKFWDEDMGPHWMKIDGKIGCAFSSAGG